MGVCAEHEQLVSKNDEVLKEIKNLNKNIESLNKNSEDIRYVLIGGVKDGKFLSGFLSRLRDIEKRQVVLNSIMVAVLIAILISSIKYVPTIIKASEIISK